MTRKAYDLIQNLVEKLGGTMTFIREGYRYGAWVITIGEKSRVFLCEGNRSLPALDQLYVPKVENPNHWDEYKHELVKDAETKLLSLLDIHSFSQNEADDLQKIIQRTKWRFSWTLARTYPHEYTTKEKSTPEDHKKLIDCIEQYGVIERFGIYFRKYFYFQDRKYWHMGEPSSDDPKKWPNVINRTWVDVRRHAENVRHCWTAEELELQMRLWEIQLEKSTDRQKSQGDSKE